MDPWDLRTCRVNLTLDLGTQSDGPLGSVSSSVDRRPGTVLPTSQLWRSPQARSQGGDLAPSGTPAPPGSSAVPPSTRICLCGQPLRATRLSLLGFHSASAQSGLQRFWPHATATLGQHSPESQKLASSFPTSERHLRGDRGGGVSKAPKARATSLPLIRAPVHQSCQNFL